MDPLAENHYGTTTYNYVLNNPLSYIDPLGLDTIGVNSLNMNSYRENIDVVGLDPVRVSAPKGSSASATSARNYGGDGSGSMHDKFMQGIDQINQFLPTTHILNSISYAVSGKDFMGNELSFGDALLGSASLIPIGKIAGPIVRGVGKIASNTGGRVFWSGGYDAMNTAMSFAKANGMTTLEMTRAGQNLTKLTQDMPWEQVGPMWQRLSATYAKGASGSVHVFQNANTGVRLNSVWRTVEYPILNGKNNIIYHNVLKP